MKPNGGKLLIIKLGGAVITYKNSLKPKAKIATIKRLAKELKKIQGLGYKLIIVHGAGSFAHGLVKKYGINWGMRNEKQRNAFIKTQQRMLKLNKIIKDKLVESDIDCISLPPHEFITQSAGKISKFALKKVTNVLNKKKAPILFGDMVIDSKWGCSVLSGDTIVCYLGSRLKADRVIFLTDVDGIYDSDPRKNTKARLIKNISDKNIESILKGLTATNRDDVTGEMNGKILHIRKMLKRIPVMIANGQKTKVIEALLREDPIGTRLLLH